MPPNRILTPSASRRPGPTRLAPRARAAWVYGLVTTLACVAAGVATTAGAADPAPSSASVEAQRAACQRAAHEDRQACLREIGAARQEAQRGRLADGGNDGVYQRNALRRCDRLPAADQADCRARITQGATLGSVKEGGVLREYREVVPAGSSAAPAVPDPASGPASDASGTPGTRS